LRDSVKHRLYGSFNNIQEWKGIWEKAEKVNRTTAYTTNERLPVEFSTSVTAVRSIQEETLQAVGVHVYFFFLMSH
jgi:hypothetical protein